jgi:hypothetical protein
MTNIEKQSIALAGQEVFELFQQPFVEDTDFGDVVQTMTNVPPDAVKRMMFNEIERYVTRAKEYCEFSPNGETDLTERQVQTYYLGIDKEYCIKSLANTILMWATKNGVNREDINGTIIGQIVMDEMRKAYDSDRKMLLWWGLRGAQAERAAADGYWSKFIPKYVGSSLIPRTTAYANRVLGFGEGIEYVEALYLQSSTELKESIEESSMVDNLCYYITRPVYDQLWKDMAEKVAGSVMGETRLEEGRKQLYWRGIPVKVAPNWERYAKKFYPASYTAGNNANIGILCHKETLLHLTDTDSAEMESYYDTTTRKNRIIVRYAMGCEIIYPTLCSVAYNH